ncbi:MAG: hypothetical protein U1F77_06605 [Kiritimatiellia bacterium]
MKNIPASHPRPPPRGGRNGIALIFVLGCLAVIVIAAISFATFMRVERLVAGQSVELSRARQSALSGLDKAIERLNRISGSTADCVYDLSGGVTNYWPRVNPHYRGTGPAQALYAGFPSGTFGGSGSKTFFPTSSSAPPLRSPPTSTTFRTPSRRM